MGEQSVDLHNSVIRNASTPQMPPATQQELKLFDFNNNGKIDDNIEKDTLINHRNYVNEAEFSKQFDFNKNNIIDEGVEKQAYKNYKLGRIAFFFSKTQYEKYNSVKNIRKELAQELFSSDMFKKEFSKDTFIDDLYFDIKYNSCQNYIYLFN